MTRRTLYSATNFPRFGIDVTQEGDEPPIVSMGDPTPAGGGTVITLAEAVREPYWLGLIRSEGNETILNEVLALAASMSLRPVADEAAVRATCAAILATDLPNPTTAELQDRVLARLAVTHELTDPEFIRAVVARWFSELCMAEALGDSER